MVALVTRRPALAVAAFVALAIAWGLGSSNPPRRTDPVAEPIEEPTPNAIPPAAHVQVPFEIGATELAPGDSIVIDAVEGPVARFDVGATYRVTGHYELASREEATLLLSVTRTERDAVDSAPARLHVARGFGTFDLEIEIRSRGFPHVTLYDAPSGTPFSGVYFGHDDWLLREKSWRYANAR